MTLEEHIKALERQLATCNAWLKYDLSGLGTPEEANSRIKRLEAALLEIKEEGGKVCEEYEICTHVACASSYAAWVIADTALAGEGQ